MNEQELAVVRQLMDAARVAGITVDSIVVQQQVSAALSAGNALIEQSALVREPVAWRNAAIRVGEDLCSVGPFGYYDMTADQWLEWALSVVTVHAPPAAQPAVPEGMKLVPVDALIRWRDAFAEELAAWDIDPPLHHVKTSHDEIDAALAAD